MPFLGNTPANTFVSIAKQTITGNGGTAYTLSYPVTNANEIDVFYNNVRQEPTVAYSASGTTITFTEAIASTDSVYVIFNGQAIGTIDAPAGAYLPTTGGTINGNLGIGATAAAKLHSTKAGAEVARFTNSLSNGGDWEFKIGGGGFEDRKFMLTDKYSGSDNVRMSLDSAGRLITPSQPAFRVYHNSNLTWNSGALSPVVYNAAVFNIGNHYNTSTGVFTAPIAGKYAFTVYEMYMGEPTYTFVYAAVQINGATTSEFMRQGTKSDYDTFGGTVILSLSANDQIRIVVGLAGVDAGYLREGSNMNSFMGYLIG